MLEPELRVGPALLTFIAFVVGALGEKLGGSGYALDPMQARSGALGASLVLGLLGILWHLTPLLLMGRSLTWIARRCLHTWSFEFLQSGLTTTPENAFLQRRCFTPQRNLPTCCFRLTNRISMCFSARWLCRCRRSRRCGVRAKTVTGRADVCIRSDSFIEDFNAMIFRSTDERYLHIHPQQRGTVAEPLPGNSLPRRFDGRFLVRIDRVVAP